MADDRKGPPLVLIMELAVMVLSAILDFLRKQGRKQG